MYWGKPDATISFCEDKYVVSKYIAEFYNTLSASSYFFVGLFFYFTKLSDIGVLLMLLGLGTAILHGTLRYYGQWFDEASMLILSLETLIYLNKNISRCVLAIL